jgi:hypothetical protein
MLRLFGSVYPAEEWQARHEQGSVLGSAAPGLEACALSGAGGGERGAREGAAAGRC